MHRVVIRSNRWRLLGDALLATLMGYIMTGLAGKSHELRFVSVGLYILGVICLAGALSTGWCLLRDVPVLEVDEWGVTLRLFAGIPQRTPWDRITSITVGVEYEAIDRRGRRFKPVPHLYFRRVDEDLTPGLRIATRRFREPIERVLRQLSSLPEFESKSKKLQT